MGLEEREMKQNIDVLDLVIAAFRSSVEIILDSSVKAICVNNSKKGDSKSRK